LVFSICLPPSATSFYFILFPPLGLIPIRSVVEEEMGSSFEFRFDVVLVELTGSAPA